MANVMAITTVSQSSLLASLNQTKVKKTDPALYEVLKRLFINLDQNNEAITGQVNSDANKIVSITGSEVLTADSELAIFPQGKELLPGTNITFDDSVANKRTVNATGGGSSTGATGAIFIGDDNYSDDFLIPGPTGPSGAAGSIGSSGVILLQDNIVPEEVLPIPGPQGIAGINGSNGTSGLVSLVEYQLPDEVFPIPGPVGPTGANGITGGAVLIETKSAASAPSLDFTNTISSTFDDYFFRFIDVVPVNSNASLLSMVSTNGGVTWDNSAIYDYLEDFAGSLFSTPIESTGQTHFFIGGQLSNLASNCGYNGWLFLSNPLSSSNDKVIQVSGIFRAGNDSHYYVLNINGQYRSTTPVNAIQFLADSGSILSGTIRSYGLSPNVSGSISPNGLGFTQFSQDLGASRNSGTFNITGLTGLVAGKNVLVMQTQDAITSKGGAQDEYEMDAITLTGVVLNSTTIMVRWHSNNPVVGIYNFAYAVGA